MEKLTKNQVGSRKKNIKICTLQSNPCEGCSYERS